MNNENSEKLMDYGEVLEYYRKIEKIKLHNWVIGLIGDLGAGKTYLVKEIINALYKEVASEVSSPTYTLCNVYNSENIEIHHYDLYRIETEDELYDTGIMESIEKENILVFVEWIDMYPQMMEICDEIIEIKLLEPPNRNYILKHQ